MTNTNGAYRMDTRCASANYAEASFSCASRSIAIILDVTFVASIFVAISIILCAALLSIRLLVLSISLLVLVISLLALYFYTLKEPPLPI